MYKKALIGPLLFILIFNMASLANAENEQPPLQMEELTIQVMPDYAFHPENEGQDSTPLLVGYHGALLNTSEVPQRGQIEIPLPVGEENFKLGFIADYSKNLSEMNEIKYELDIEAGTISWTTSEEIHPQELYRFVIEYYTDSIQVDKTSHTLDYGFESFSDIGLVNLIFVEPLNTDSFKLEPAAESHQKNSYGMNMFIYMVQGMKAGEEKAIKLEYERSDERTTSKILEDMVGASPTQGTSTENEEIIPIWLIITIIGGVTVIAAVVLILFLRKKTQTDKEQKINGSATDMKKAKLREMLVDGKISEEEYGELLKKVGGK
ncbi:hypothetical protein [Bacillus sp. B15-48]|uniref:hypothetical protein n=1 Tax=Bacillus sp. B15-48 TaxID=1548601 RepID=UPI00193ECF7B|nr:hypothetical protein [Bacillus sp. B15-48]